MALNSSRSAFSIVRQALRPLRRAPHVCRQPIRAVSSFESVESNVSRHNTGLREKDDWLNPPPSEEDVAEKPHQPRWSHTPERMIGEHGFSLNPIKNPSRRIWQVNEDPEVLDQFYDRFLGRDGCRMLPEELKWLAVTHKSFDYGRRGFNTRLAYFGRQIMVLEAMNDIMTSPGNPAEEIKDPFERTFQPDPALNNVDKLSIRQPQDVLSKEKLASLAISISLHDVTRWKPRVPENLKGSGLDTVLATSVFAIVGAICLQHGAAVAARVAREKILRRLPTIRS